MSKTAFSDEDFWEQFELLPEPVKRYLELVLKDNQEIIKAVNLTHSGSFKTSPKSNWVKIKGEQYFKTDVPEFEWTGKTKLFKAVDKYIDGKGSLTVRLLSLIPIVKEKGKHVDQAELLRWLGESVWFPTNLLPCDNLKWFPIDSLHSKLTYRYNGIDVFYNVTFNETGEIVQLQSERYKENDKLEKWTGKVSEYHTFDGMKIPTHIEAFWQLNDVDFQYVDFYVDTIEYEY